MAAVDERVAEALADKAKALATVRGWGGKDDRVNVAKARMVQDEDVLTTQQELVDAYAYRKLLEPIHDAYVRDAQVVSRELTRRTDREGPVRRNDRWGVA